VRHGVALLAVSHGKCEAMMALVREAGLGPKGRWSGVSASNTHTADGAPPAERQDRTHTGNSAERGNPDLRARGYRYKARSTHARSIQLTRRNAKLIEAIHRYRMLHRGQVADLFFAGIDDEGSSARRLQSLLYQHGYPERIPRYQPRAGISPGSARGSAVGRTRQCDPRRVQLYNDGESLSDEANRRP
jgi:hypothetical protein